MSLGDKHPQINHPRPPRANNLQTKYDRLIDSVTKSRDLEKLNFFGQKASKRNRISTER